MMTVAPTRASLVRALFLLVIGLALVVPALAGNAATTDRSVPHGVLWGMSDSSGDDGARFDATELQLGRRMTLVREYHRIDQPFVKPREQQLVDTGHSIVLSIRAANSAGVPVPYAAITAGQYDAVFLNGLRALNALATPSYFIFQHEADGTTAKKSCSSTNDAVCGQQFIAAWKHVRGLAQAAGYSNVDFVWNVTAYGFSTTANKKATNYWPGQAATDWIGIDQYNGGCTGRYMSFEEMLEGSIAWTSANAPNVPIMLPEWGATEGEKSLDKAGFFSRVPDTLTKPGYDQIKALVYWNETSSSTCDFRIDTSTQSFATFAGVGLTPVFTPRPVMLPGQPRLAQLSG